jgi:hypothetical protein
MSKLLEEMEARPHGVFKFRVEGEMSGDGHVKAEQNCLLF